MALRNINTLIADNYTNNNNQVTFLSDGAQHLAGKSFFCKLDCSLAFHCRWQTKSQWKSSPSIWPAELLSWKTCTRSQQTCVCFSSFTRECLDPTVKANQCAQYVEDIGIAANIAMDRTRNIRAVLQCIRQAVLKLTFGNCRFGVRQIEFLGRTISCEGVSPQINKIQKNVQQIEFL